jgi:hypothetical protein
MQIYTADCAAYLAWPAAQIERRLGLEPGTIDAAMRLVIATHDLGKLDIVWQKWAKTWQRELRRIDPGAPQPAVDAVIAHTTRDYDDAQQRELERQMRSLVGAELPAHATSGAAVAGPLIDILARRSTAQDTSFRSLARAMTTAIVQHHHASFPVDAEHGDFHGVTGGKPRPELAHGALIAALGHAGLRGDPLIAGAQPAWVLQAGQMERDARVQPGSAGAEHQIGLLIYLLLVRVLRLVDSRSQEVS